MDLTCKDCRYFLPVDVFSGICKMDKKKISHDLAACEKVEKVAKCKFCQNYTSDREFLGKCMGSTLAYPDMNGSKCADFKWIVQN
jgi:hypothetical protein